MNARRARAIRQEIYGEGGSARTREVTGGQHSRERVEGGKIRRRTQQALADVKRRDYQRSKALQPIRLAEVVKLARLRTGRSAEQLAKEIGIAPHKLRRLENGTHEPAVETFVRVLRWLLAENRKETS